MDFSKRKLPSEAAITLHATPVSDMLAHRPVSSPVYVYLRANEKFVSVKAPLDFFTEPELERLKSYEFFYTPRAMDSVLPYQDAGVAIRRLLEWKPDEDQSRPTHLPPASYELSDSVLRMLAPLWGPQAEIEPFFVVAFVEEICDALSVDALMKARDTSVEHYEGALTAAAWAVFLALHLGHCNRGFLTSLRRQVFLEASGIARAALLHPITRDLCEAALKQTAKGAGARVTVKALEETKDELVFRIQGRFKRMRDDLGGAAGAGISASIYGSGGFVDV